LEFRYRLDLLYHRTLLELSAREGNHDENVCWADLLNTVLRYCIPLPNTIRPSDACCLRRPTARTGWFGIPTKAFLSVNFINPEVTHSGEEKKRQQT
jgi:hypothetical protein